jgi:hypothetical protein
MTAEDLREEAREAHRAMLSAFDAFTATVLTAEAEAMRAHHLGEGATPDDAARAAHDHVARIRGVLAIERAALEAEAETIRH